MEEINISTKQKYAFASKDCCAFAFKHQKIPRSLFARLEGVGLSALHGCGLYDYLALLSRSTSFKDEQGSNFKAGFEVVRKLLGYRSRTATVNALGRLCEMQLINVHFQKDGGRVLIDIIGNDKENVTLNQMQAEKNACFYQSGFFFVSKDIQKYFSGVNRISERDALADLLLNVVINDESVRFSEIPVFTLGNMQNGYSIKHSMRSLAARWKCSIGRTNYILHKLHSLQLIELKTYKKAGTFVFIPQLTYLLFFKKSNFIEEEKLKNYAFNLCSWYREMIRSFCRINC